MRVIIKNRFVTLKGGSTVKDENKQDVYKVKGKLFTFTRKKVICDMQNHKLYKVRNRLINIVGDKAYVFDDEGNKVATVYHPPFAVKKFVVKGAEDEIMIKGEFFSRQCTIERNGQVVGSLTNANKFFDLTDSFLLEATPEDMPFMIALVICIDNIRDKIFKSRR